MPLVLRLCCVLICCVSLPSFAVVSAYFADLSSGCMLYQENAFKNVVPASVSKLVVGAEALDIWGEQGFFQTQLWAVGDWDPVSGVLNGDLVFYGSGDPYFTTENLFTLLQQAWGAGLRKITGKVIINDSYFARLDSVALRKSVVAGSGDHAYDAPLSASSINFNVAEIQVSSGIAQNTPPVVSVLPPVWPQTAIKNFATTLSEKSVASISAQIQQDQNQETFMIKGGLPLHGAPVFLYRSIAEPNLYLGKILQHYLKAMNIEFSNLPIEVQHTALSKDNMKLVAVVTGRPVADQLKGAFHFSNNFIADMLFLQIGKHFAPQPDQVLQTAQEWSERFIQTAVSQWAQALRPTASEHQLAMSAEGLAFVSGSGLSTRNHVSAFDMVSVLYHVYQSNSFPVFLAALPQAGMEGTVRRRLKQKGVVYTQSLFRVKSGTLHEDVPTSSLAGYFRDHQGHWIAFAVIANGPQSGATQNLSSFVDQYVLSHLPNPNKE